MPARYLILLAVLLLTGTVGRADAVQYASLKKSEVNWRTGPGEKYPIQWVYREVGYPVRVLDAYDVWRQVQDVAGTVGWVHQNMLTDRRTVLVRQEGVLTRKPDNKSKPVAFVEPETVARVLKCPEHTDKCLLSFRFQDEEYKGWFPRRLVWGLNDLEIID